MKLQIILEPGDEGGFIVYVPSLPGCISEADTREDAPDIIGEIIALYLEPIKDDSFLPGPGAQVLEIAV